MTGTKRQHIPVNLKNNKTNLTMLNLLYLHINFSNNHSFISIVLLLNTACESDNYQNVDLINSNCKYIDIMVFILHS